MANARSEHTITLLSDHRVLVAGGWSPDLTVYATTELIDLTSGTWSPSASMPEARLGHTASLLSDGRVLVAGGGNRESGILDTVALYDPSTDSWSPSGSMAQARVGHTATVLTDGRVLMVGGDQQWTAGIFDPSTGKGSPTGKIEGHPRRTTTRHTATLLADGRVLTVSGTEDSFREGLVQLYDPSTNSWSVAANMAQPPIAFHTANLLKDGRVLVTGPVEDETEIDLRPTAELYDPATDSWSPAGSMTQARGGHTATLLSDGTVLVAGGASGRYLRLVDSSEGAESFDPSTDSWSSVESMVQPRMNHRAILLPNGTVLVVGGEVTLEEQGLYHQQCDMFAPCPFMLASAELYEPSSGTWHSNGPAPPVGPEEDDEPLRPPGPSTGP